MGFLIRSFWPMTSHQLLKNSQALCNAICLSRAQWKNLVAESILYLFKAWRYQDDNGLEVSSLLSAFYSVRSYLGHYWRRKLLKNLIQLCTLWTIITSGQEDILISTLVAWTYRNIEQFSVPQDKSHIWQFCQTKNLLILLPVYTLHLFMNI